MIITLCVIIMALTSEKPDHKHKTKPVRKIMMETTTIQDIAKQALDYLQRVLACPMMWPMMRFNDKSTIWSSLTNVGQKDIKKFHHDGQYCDHYDSDAQWPEPTSF